MRCELWKNRKKKKESRFTTKWLIIYFLWPAIICVGIENNLCKCLFISAEEASKHYLRNRIHNIVNSNPIITGDTGLLQVSELHFCENDC
jgi:hypothetical protein